MTATFRITQDAVVGEYGIARQDLTLFSVGGTITLEAQDQTGGLSDYVWEVLSEPYGSSVTITTPAPAAPWEVEVDLTVTGGYLFRLVFKPGTVDEDIQTLYLGIPLPNSGLCLPALNETFFDNSYAAGGSGDTYVGYERKNTALFKWIDTISGGGGLPGGVDTQIQYNNAGAFGGSALYYDAASAKLGLRNPAPFFDLDIVSAAGVGAAAAIRSYSDSDSGGIIIGRARGSFATPEAVVGGDLIGGIQFLGYYGSGAFDLVQGALIGVTAAEGYTAGAAGSDLVIHTAKHGEPLAGLTATFTAYGDLEMENGSIRVHSYNGPEQAGIMEWDGTNFRGYTGSAWVYLDVAGGTDVTLAASATTGGLSIVGQEIGFQAATTSTSGYLTSTDWNTFNGKADHAPVTLAASATTGGLDITGQEIGFQAATAGTPAASALVSLGDVDTASKRLSTTSWGANTWWASGSYVKEIFRYDGGTTWTSFLNASDNGNGSYDWHVWHDGELWTGMSYNGGTAHRMWSFNPDTEVWTGRGGVSDVVAFTGIGVWDSTVVVGNIYDYVYKYVSGTTWTSLGQPGAGRIQEFADAGGTLFSMDEYGVVHEYSGSGTIWSNTSVPMPAEQLTVWNGVLVAACKDAGKPVVYKYEASTWTKLGGDLSASTYTFFEFIAVDSLGNLYAQPSGGTTTYIYKYDPVGDSWSSVLSYVSGAGSAAHPGEFNPSDIAGFGVAYDEIRTFQDDHYDPINGYLTSEDWRTFNGKADHAPVTLAASATTGGLDITGQEIGFQAATAGTPVAASEVSFGDPTIVNTNHDKAIPFDGTWYLSADTGTGEAGTLYRHDGGTSWTKITNPSYTASYNYGWLVELGGEIWCGTIDFPAETDFIYSYNADTTTWTGRGKHASMTIIDRGCVHGGKVVVVDRNGLVYENTSGTTWTVLGTPAGAGLGQIDSDGTDLFRAVGGEIYKYDTGTSWDALSFPSTTVHQIKNWNGTLIASGATGGNAEVYKYNGGTSWTKLGTTVGGESVECLAINSDDELYAVTTATSTFQVMKYNATLDSWSLALDLSIYVGGDGSFNADDELCIPGANLVALFKDDSYDPINGYLTSEDWRTFNDKAAAAQTMYIGTTAVAINRASAALTLAGITLTTPNIGTPSAGVLTSCTGLPVAGLADGTDGELITWGADGVAATVAAGTSGQVLTSNGAGAAPTFQAGGGGGLTWTRVTASTTATSGNGYLVDATSNSVSISLPSSPSAGDIVAIQVYDAAYTVLVNRNTNNIEGAAFSPALTKGDSATFVYAEATEGWVRVGKAGGTIHATVSSTLTTLDTFTDSVNGAAQYMYFISNAGTNIRSGTVRIHWDGVANLIEKDETSVTSIGDTSDFVFTADIDTGMVRLRGDADASYSVRLVKTTI